MSDLYNEGYSQPRTTNRYSWLHLTMRPLEYTRQMVASLCMFIVQQVTVMSYQLPVMDTALTAKSDINPTE